MQKFLARLLGNEEPPAQPSAAFPIQAQYQSFFHQAQLAAQRQDWDSARSAYEAGLSRAVTDQNNRAQQFFLSGLGTIYYKKQNWEAAEKYTLDALDFAHQLADPILQARAQINLGEIYAAQKHWEAAKPYQEQALENARVSRDIPTLLIAQESLARTHIEQSNATYAIHLLKEAITTAQEARDARAGASLVGWLGEAHVAKGERAQGQKYLEQAQLLAIQTGRDALALQWIHSLSKLDMIDKNYTSAIERLQAAEDLARRIGQQPKDFFIQVALQLSECYRILGNASQAQFQAERAVLHSQELNNPILQMQAQTALGLALQSVGKHAEAVTKLEAALAFYENQAESAPDLSGILTALGKSHLRLRQNEAAEVAFNHALELARQADNPLREAESLHLLGSVKAALNATPEAMDLWKQAIRIYEAQSKWGEAARALCDLGNTRRLQGDLSAATHDFENALTYLSHVDDRVTRGLVLSNAANLYTQVGDMPTAEAFYKESIQIARDLHDLHSESIRKGNLAWFYVLTGKLSQAIHLLEEALSISQRLNDPLLQAIQVNNSGYAYARNGRHEMAVDVYNKAMGLLQGSQAERWVGIISSNIGASMVELGKLEDARLLYETALNIGKDLNDKENLIRTQHRMAHWLRLQSRLEEARELAEQTYNEARRMGYRKGQGDAARVLGDVYQALGEPNNAQLYYAEAHKVYQRISDPLADKYAQYAV